MSWVTIIIDPDDNKVKVDWFYLRKIIHGTVRGDQFMYIFLKLVTNIVLIAIVFLS